MIIGGGLSGSLMAIFLAKRGFQVDVFERRPDMRYNRIPAGRSINLALSIRGIHALSRVGLTDEVMKDAIPMYGRMMHGKDGKLNYQPYGKEGQAINSVSRGRLNTRLLEMADEHVLVNLYFNHRCVDVNYENRTAQFEDEHGQIKTYSADRILGTDGAFAATRGRLQISDRFDYSQSYLYVGYKELAIPAGIAGAFRMEKNALHIWPRGAFMMIALPNPSGDFTCTLFLAHQGNPSFEILKTNESVMEFFENWFPDAIPLMPTLLKDFQDNPSSSLCTVRCFPWVKDDAIALLGDAAHAVVPFFGQGMNCSFEDVVVMDECIEKYLPDWNRVFAEYQALRKPNADAIADLAIANFYEMAEKVGDAEFLERKRIEHILSEQYPDLFQSQYELVTFSRVPYKQALDRGPINDRILNEISHLNLQDKLLEADLIVPILSKYQP